MADLRPPVWLEYLSRNFDGRVEFCDGRVFFDSNNGAGSTPNNANVRYMGFAVLMQPWRFFQLVTMLDDRRDSTFVYLAGTATNPGWGPPMLYVDADERRVLGHEGRHRVTVFQDLCGEYTEVLVHILPRRESFRARTVNQALLDHMRDGLISEGRSGFLRKGPIFNVAFVENRIVTWPFRPGSKS